MATVFRISARLDSTQTQGVFIITVDVMHKVNESNI